MWLLSFFLCIGDVWAQAPAEEPGQEADDGVDEARVLFENGKRLYEEGAYEAAIEAWEACYALTDRVELLYNLSNAHERSGRFSEALQLLNRYRAVASVSDEEQARLSRKASVLAQRAMPPPPEERQGTNRRTVGAVTAVGGGVAMVLGAVLGGSSLAARGEVRESCLSTPSGFLCPSEGRLAAQRAQQSGSWSLVALGVGGVGLATGVALTVTAPIGKRSAPSVEVGWRF